MMKKVFYAVIIAAGLLALATGCSKETLLQNEEGSGVLVITIQNSNSGATRAMGTDPGQTAENTVLNFAAFVFNSSSGAYEASGIFNNQTNGIIENLSTASSKRVVVLVNYDFTNMPTINNYSDLDAMTINIDSQIPDFSTNALFMSGEADGVTVVPNTVTDVEINVDRVVAKIRLASLTIDPTASSDLNLFTLEGVSMQKVPYWAYMLGDETYEVDPNDTYTYAGGISGGTVSVEVLGHLHNTYSLPSGYTAGNRLEPEIYYYVFPNDAVDNEATLLTIYGTYNGKNAYYTFAINSEDLTGQGSSTADGTYIKRNMVYELHVTLRNLALPADNPDAINELGDINVIVVPLPWAGNLIQNVSW